MMPMTALIYVARELDAASQPLGCKVTHIKSRRAVLLHVSGTGPTAAWLYLLRCERYNLPPTAPLPPLGPRTAHIYGDDPSQAIRTMGHGHRKNGEGRQKTNRFAAQSRASIACRHGTLPFTKGSSFEKRGYRIRLVERQGSECGRNAAS